MGRVLTSAPDHPQAVARGMRIDLENAAGRRVPVAGSPLCFEGEGARAQHVPSLAGADTAAVLAELLNLAPARLQALAGTGVSGALVSAITQETSSHRTIAALARRPRFVSTWCKCAATSRRHHGHAVLADPAPRDCWNACRPRR
jgi:hypothetical protein